MKKIYVNRTKRAIVFGDTMLLPGSNVAEEIDEKKFPMVKHLLDEGEIVIETDSERAIRDANTQKVTDEIMKLDKENEKTQSAGKKRKQQLDKIDEEAKAAAESSKKSDDEEKQEEA